MMMLFNKKIVLFFTISLIAFSCSKKAEADTPLQAEDTIQIDPVVFKGEDERAERQMILESFTTLPSEIDGCSCYYSLTDNDFHSNKYVFASNLGNDGFAKINGAMAKLRLIKTDSISPSHSIKTYQGDNYGIILEAEKTGELDETWQQKGKLTVIENNKEIFYIDITGECGC